MASQEGIESEYDNTADTFDKMDKAFGDYYNMCYQYNPQNSEYYPGMFIDYVTSDELYCKDILDEELGESANPSESLYVSIFTNNNEPFPIPKSIILPNNSDKIRELYTFYILQYFYKQCKSPTIKDIQQKILPRLISNKKCAANIKSQQSKPLTISFNDETKDEVKDNTVNFEVTPDDLPPPAFHPTSIITNYKITSIQSSEQPLITPIITRVNKKLFDPKYPARAHLNIYTPKECTESLQSRIIEQFDNPLMLYYYTDMSTGLQINDQQVYEYTIIINHETKKIVIINYDLHDKCTQNHEILYGVIVPNDDEQIQNDKWLWKVDKYLNAHEIHQKYEIDYKELPKSSREMDGFKQQLHFNKFREAFNNNPNFIENTDWFSIQQIKSLKRNVKIPKVTVRLTKEMWMKSCKISFANSRLPLIPVVLSKRNRHWIEWVKIIYIESQDIHIGVSLKYENNLVTVQSLCLDRGDIINKHKLTGLNRDNYNKQLQDFKTSIYEIKWSDNHCDDVERKINVLKQQITAQQNCIIRYKETLLRIKNENNQKNNDKASHEIDNDHKTFLQNDDEFISEPDNDDKDNMLSMIVDDVIKPYNVNEFNTKKPVGAKMNIFIPKELTRALLTEIQDDRFKSDNMMYYWLDYTTAIQMIQKYAKLYTNKETGQFVVIIINYELKNRFGHNLYGIVLRDETKSIMDKYSYKLEKLSTKEQVHAEYGIHSFDLPKKSRKHPRFKKGLLIKRKITKSDVSQINFSNLKLFRSQSSMATMAESNANNRNVNNIYSKAVTITKHVMREYINVALDRLNNGDHQHTLIPIMVCDKQNRNYGIEWVLIVNIIHRQCDVGISFNYNITKDLFQAKAVYLDKSEIVSKHRLIGLKHDYCKNLRDFSVKKLRFKGNSAIINDDNEDDMECKNDVVSNNKNNNAVINAKEKIKQYQNAIQTLNSQNLALEQQLLQQQQQQHVHSQQVSNYRQQMDQSIQQQFNYNLQMAATIQQQQQQLQGNYIPNQNYYQQQQQQSQQQYQVNYEQQQQQLAQLRQEQENYLQQQQEQYQQYSHNNNYHSHQMNGVNHVTF